MENVPRSPLRKDLTLCGSNFGLKVVRHRIFEFFDGRTWKMPPCNHPLDVVTVCGHGTPRWVMNQRKARGFVENPPIAEKRKEMGIYWMNRGELAQAIPPAYSKYIAQQFKLAAPEPEGRKP